jgi:hypothetical protein
LHSTVDPRVLGLERTTIPGSVVLGSFLSKDALGAIYEAHSARDAKNLWARVVPETLRVQPNMAGLKHPNLASVHSQAVTKSGVTIVVFEAPSGESIAQRVAQKKPFEPQEVVSCTLQILSGLHALHSIDELHSNLSAGSVFWADTDKTAPKAVLIDHWLGSTGKRFNSPNYRAPEQIRHHAPIARTTDIWAMGILLYEMLQGRLPFDGRTESEIVGKVLLMDPRLKAPNTDLGRLLTGVVARAMRKKPEDRYQSVTAIMNELLPIQEKLGGMNAEAIARLRQSLAPEAAMVSTAPVAPASQGRGPKGPPIVAAETHKEPAPFMPKNLKMTPLASPGYEAQIAPAGPGATLRQGQYFSRPPSHPAPQALSNADSIVMAVPLAPEELPAMPTETSIELDPDLIPPDLPAMSSDSSASLEAALLEHASSPLQMELEEPVEQGPSLLQRWKSSQARWVARGSRLWSSTRERLKAASLLVAKSTKGKLKSPSLRLASSARVRLKAASLGLSSSARHGWTVAVNHLRHPSRSERIALGACAFTILAVAVGLFVFRDVFQPGNSFGAMSFHSLTLPPSTMAQHEPRASSDSKPAEKAKPTVAPVPKASKGRAPQADELLSPPTPRVKAPPVEKPKANKRKASIAPDTKQYAAPRSKPSKALPGKRKDKKGAGPITNTQSQDDAEALASNPFGG